jgi:RNA ligase (TIGR02306 family)
MTERSLATIRKIDNIKPIVGADAIELAIIGGWQVVVKKDEFKIGEFAIYFEIDSWVPHTLAPFLTKPGHNTKVYDGVEGQRLKTIKLRGKLSQGLLLPLSTITETIIGWVYDENWYEGQDLTEALGIKKWEPPVEAQLAGEIKGRFPYFIRKTDQERCQNLVNEIFNHHHNEEFEVTLKLDGSSMTVFKFDKADYDPIGVCSRNQQLKLEQEGNAFVDLSKKTGILKAIEKIEGNYAIQGELMGPRVQGNRENLKEHEFYVFDIFDIDQGEYLDPLTRRMIFSKLLDYGANIKHVPIVHDFFNLSVDGNITSIEDLLKFADGKSLNNPVREGLVFKSYNSDFTFKAISNSYLLKNQ